MTATSGEKTRTDVGLDAAATEAVCKSLNGYLADLHVIYTKLHNFHWNVEGPAFYTLHEVLETLYDAVHAEIDEVAERVLKLGHRPLASLADYTKAASLHEEASRSYSGKELVDILLKDYQHLAHSLRETIELAGGHGDEGTADDAVGMLKDKEKTIWMLTAYNS
ncbi:MAG: DNA starvation/stationary phase protection protein [Spirochaetaceae bacterium]|nr:MAG: DNA starvation/stationary phase protection protein [Spirochaetaceae bacterium]